MNDIPNWYSKGDNPWYIRGKYLEVGQGNNAFSLPKNETRERLYLTPLKLGSLSSLKVGTEIAFQDYDGEKWMECRNYVESGDFVDPTSLHEFRRTGGRKSIVDRGVVINLDLDVFHPDMNHISWAQKVAVLKHYLPQTRLITMATSPYFIDQGKAIDIVKRVVRELF